MDPNQTIEFLKTLLERQENMYEFLFMILIGITTILVGSTWLWNFFISKKQISLEIEKKSKFFENKVKEIEENQKTYINAQIDLKLSRVQIDISRLFAIISKDKKMSGVSLAWWLNCLRNSIESKNDKLIRIAADQIISLLADTELTTYRSDFFEMESTLKMIEQLPDLLHDEKLTIIKKLKKLKLEES